MEYDGLDITLSRKYTCTLQTYEPDAVVLKLLLLQRTLQDWAELGNISTPLDELIQEVKIRAFNPGHSINIQIQPETTQLNSCKTWYAERRNKSSGEKRSNFSTLEWKNIVGKLSTISEDLHRKIDGVVNFLTMMWVAPSMKAEYIFKIETQLKNLQNYIAVFYGGKELWMLELDVGNILKELEIDAEPWSSKIKQLEGQRSVIRMQECAAIGLCKILAGKLPKKEGEKQS